MRYFFHGGSIQSRALILTFLLSHENTFLRLSMLHAWSLSVSTSFFSPGRYRRETSINCFPTHDYKAVPCFKQISGCLLGYSWLVRYREGIARPKMCLLLLRTKTNRHELDHRGINQSV